MNKDKYKQKLIPYIVLLVLVAGSFYANADGIRHAGISTDTAGVIISHMPASIDVASSENREQHLNRPVTSAGFSNSRTGHVRNVLTGLGIFCLIGIASLFAIRHHIICVNVCGSHRFIIRYIHNLDGLKA